MQRILLRIFVFFVHSIGLIALLPLVAKALHADATTYTMLLASMGVGAIVTGLTMPRISSAAAPDRIVAIGVVLYAAATATVALTSSFWLIGLALAVSGGVWLSVVNTITMSAQLVLPNSLRARGMAIYQMAIMGGSAAGAALWGQVASHSSVSTALLASAATSLVVLWLTHRITVQIEAHQDLTLPTTPISS